MAVAEKRKQEESGTPKSSVLSSNEVAFPRGGSSVLTPLELKEVSNQAQRDVLFEVPGGDQTTEGESQGPQRKKKKTSKSKTKDISLPKSEAQVDIEHFTLKNVTPGMSVFGQIIEINHLELVLALPDNLRGFVPITNISSELTSLIEEVEEEDSSSDEEEDSKPHVNKDVPSLRNIFQKGQWLRAVVTEASNKKQKKRIVLTIEPSKVNGSLEEEDFTSGSFLQGSVHSTEDHGVILSFGSSDSTGFISNKELKSGNIAPQNIVPGTVLLTQVSKKTGRTLTCRLPNSKKPAVVSSISSVDAISAGALVEALVTEIKNNGLVCKVFGLCTATINLTHLGIYDFASIKHKIAIGSKFSARVLASFTKQNEKRLCLSILPHLISLPLAGAEDPLQVFPIGHVFSDVEIKGKDASYIFINLGISKTLGQAHVSRVSENADMDMDFKIGSKHPARVLGFSAADNLYVLTLDKKQVEQEFLRPQDLPIGKNIVGEVSDIVGDKGLKLKLVGSDFEAFVPRSHMSDIRLVYPERKFKIGSKVKGRVLRRSNKVSKSSIEITLKKSLVGIEDDAVIGSIDQVEKGKRTAVTIEKILPTGCVVSFFGRLRAFLPKADLSETFVQKPEDHVKVGQTVAVRVTDVDKEQGKIKVSCLLRDVSDDTETQSMNNLLLGKTILSVKVAEKEKDSVIVEVPGMAVRGIIFAGQLTDGNFEQNRAYLKKVAVGSELKCVVLDRDMKARVIHLSAKESLKAAAESDMLPSSFRDITASDKSLRGYVKSVTEKGVFVGFAGKLTGLVLPKYASDKRIDSLASAFYPHQSVSCHVIRTDEDNKRFLLSLKTAENNGESAISPVDESIQNLSEYVPGKITKACIRSVKATQLNVQLADNLQGRINITELFDDISEIKDQMNPLSQFHRGDVLDVKVIGFHDPRTHRFLPISHRNTKQVIVELCAKKSVLSQAKLENLTLSNISVGSKWLAFVNNLSRTFYWCSISPSVKGKLSFMRVDPKVTYQPGAAVQVYVVSVDAENNVIELNARTDDVTSLNDIEVGSSVPARVLKAKDTFVILSLGENVKAVSFITDALDDYSKQLEDVFSTNDVVSAKILSVDKDSSKVSVSLKSESPKDRLITSVNDLNRGDVVRGFVKNVTDSGVFVALGRDVHALVRVSELSDSYIKEWKKYFKPHQLVVGKIISAQEEGRVSMTLKETEVNGELNTVKRFEDLQVGDIFDGSVRRATDFGVFVKLDGTFNVSGLCHRSEISDKKIEDASTLFEEGDRVKVKVLGVNSNKKQLSLGMKASYFISGGDDAESDIEMDEGAEDASDAEISNSSSDDEMQDAGPDDSSESDSEHSESDSEEKPTTAGLSTNGFDWTASILDQAKEEEVSSDDEMDFADKKSRKKAKQHRATEDKTGDLSLRQPESVADFERLIVGNPNSSVLWMNYMSFQLQLSEVEKAREIGERSLKTIHFREESEKLNIWIAMLNLENTFGTDETLEDVFKRACQYMDALLMHRKLVGIFAVSERFGQAEKLYSTMAKKFSQDVSVWVDYGRYLLEQDRHEDSHSVLSRALTALPKRDHVTVVRKFAQLEFELGDPEQGRSLFEGLIADASKRVDLWNVYIDQEMKQDARKKVQDLFERVFTVKLSRKQAKFFFKKWLTYEEEHGDVRSTDYVKAKAAEYVNSHEGQN